MVSIGALVLLKRDHTNEQIAEITGLAVEEVSERLHKYGLKCCRGRTDITVDEVVKLWNDGLTIVEIAKHFNCSHDTITKRLKSVGIACDRKSGILRHFERTHDELWPDIKIDLDKGFSPSALADKYHMRYDNIFRLMKKHNYEGEVFDANLTDLANRIVVAEQQADDVLTKYLEAVQSYAVRNKSLPTRHVLADLVGDSYGKTVDIIKKYNLQFFIDNSFSCGSAERLAMELDKLGVDYDMNNRAVLVDEVGNSKEFDFYIPSIDLGLEVNPTGTHSVDVEKYGVKDKLYHQKKALLAERFNCGLLHLYDIDFFDERRFSVLMRQLKGRLADNRIRLGARQCEFKVVDAGECNKFLNDYHFQGAERSSSYRCGLYYDDVLVAVLCVGKSRYTSDDYEIVRYCVHPDYIISGVFGKLFKSCVREFDLHGTVVSYMDLNKRFSSNNVYEKNGFMLTGITQPGYWWARKHGVPILSRHETTKAKLIEQGFDARLTEVQIMRARGYFRVFDAGSKRYVIEV